MYETWQKDRLASLFTCSTVYDALCTFHTSAGECPIECSLKDCVEVATSLHRLARGLIWICVIGNAKFYLLCVRVCEMTQSEAIHITSITNFNKMDVDYVCKFCQNNQLSRIS